jgi:hypothetical protein
MRRWLIAVVVPAGMAAGLGAAAPAASAAPACQVINKATHASYGDLQPAVSAAAPGATLLVRGTCTGNYTIGANLTLAGQRPDEWPAPTLDGNHAGTVLTVTGGTVTITSLTITNGAAAGLGGSFGGGIDNNGGTVILRHSHVTGNTADGSGGGIDNNGGTVILRHSRVTGNTAGGFGGGIYNTNASDSVTLTDSSVTGNTAGDGGGIFNFGSVTLTDSSVRRNTAQSGGGIFNNGSVTLKYSSVTGNTATGFGGGGITNNGSVTLKYSSVTGNTTTGDGGGILNDVSAGGTLTGAVAGKGGNVYGNKPDNIATV